MPSLTGASTSAEVSAWSARSCLSWFFLPRVAGSPAPFHHPISDRIWGRSLARTHSEEAAVPPPPPPTF